MKGTPMMGSINPALSSLSQTNNALSGVMSRLSSGKRLNSSQDDPAGLAISSLMSAQLGSNAQAQSNISMGLALSETASGALGQVSDTLQRMRELAVQSANGTNTPGDRQAIQQEFSQLSQSLDQVASQTQFNGQKLLDGSFSASLQTGPNAGNTFEISGGNVSAQGLGVNSLDITTASNATGAISAIDQAISNIGAQQGAVGASQSGLEAAATNLSVSYESLASAKSQKTDTNYAKETTTFAQERLRQDVASKMVSLYQANQSSVLRLIPGATALKAIG
jgi:flagellin